MLASPASASWVVALSALISTGHWDEMGVRIGRVCRGEREREGRGTGSPGREGGSGNREGVWRGKEEGVAALALSLLPNFILLCEHPCSGPRAAAWKVSV